MIDPLLGNTDQNDLPPEEIRKTLMGFLGQTYQEIAKFDSNLINTNPFLSPKKEEFKTLAEKVIQESVGIPNRQHSLSLQNQSHVHHVGTNFVPPIQQPQINTDPNQMEFSFDNSITAITINNKLESLERKINNIDKLINTMISSLEGYDAKDKK